MKHVIEPSVSFTFLFAQVHRGIKGVIRDKVSKQGIADAIVKVEDHGHDIRSGQSLGFSIRKLLLQL